MNTAIEPKKITCVEFTQSHYNEQFNYLSLWTKASNTYKLIKGKGAIQEIFGNMPLNPYVHKFPTFLANIAIVKNPIIAKKAFQYSRNDQGNEGIFSSEKNSFSRFLSAVFPEIGIEDAILTCSKEKASLLHSFLISQFASKNINYQKQLIQEEVDTTLDHWASLPEVNIANETKLFTSSVIGKLFLGYDGSYENLTKAVDEVFAHLGMGSKIAKWKQRILFWKHLWDPSVNEKQKRLDNAVTVIKKAIEEVMNNQGHLCAEMQSQISEEDKNIFSENDIRAMILTLFIAGQDTTANLLNYILLKLAQDPALQESVYNGEISIKNLIREGIRMFTPATLVGRYTSKNLNLTVTFDDETTNSWHIPKDTLFTPAPTLMAKDPHVVQGEENLDIFMPSRWEEKQSSTPLRSLPWIPFGHGFHACPGVNLAEQEIELFLNSIIEQFIFSTEIIGELGQTTSFVNRLTGDIPITMVKR